MIKFKVIFGLVCVLFLVGCSQTKVDDNGANQTAVPTDNQQAESVDLIGMVMIDGQLFISSENESDISARCGNMDGEISTHVANNQIPDEHNQSNFGSGYKYQFVDENNVDIVIDKKWIRFVAKSNNDD